MNEGKFNNENEKNPLYPIIKLEYKIDTSTEQIRILYEKYNHIIDKWNKNKGLFNVIGKMEIENKLKKIDTEIGKIFVEIKNTQKELDFIIKKMETEN